MEHRHRRPVAAQNRTIEAMNPGRQFASDNQSGMCPEVLQAIIAANGGHAAGYGEDERTARAADLVRTAMGVDGEVFFVCTGTAGNALALAACAGSYNAVFCHESAHIDTDECGAPEFFSGGAKLIPVGGGDGRIDAARLRELVARRSDLHFPRPRALSLTQPTELGTVYGLEELRTLGAAARELGLRVHMDGARFANAVVALGVDPAEILRAAAVDVLCLGGAKNGGMVGEAVVFIDRPLARDFEWRCKQSGQLVAKMRFLAAQWEGLLTGGAWLRHAAHANRMAGLLRDRLFAAGIRSAYPAQVNAVFLDLSAAQAAALRALGWVFYGFIGGAARFVCAWDTEPEAVEALARDIVSVVLG